MLPDPSARRRQGPRVDPGERRLGGLPPPRHGHRLRRTLPPLSPQEAAQALPQPRRVRRAGRAPAVGCGGRGRVTGRERPGHAGEPGPDTGGWRRAAGAQAGLHLAPDSGGQGEQHAAGLGRRQGGLRGGAGGGRLSALESVAGRRYEPFL
jgi:hypothetical protein